MKFCAKPRSLLPRLRIIPVMRACFLGQNICALGFGVATLQMPPVPLDDPLLDEETGKSVERGTNKPVDQKGLFRPTISKPASANPL
jgi:hypothetical protein